MITEIDFPRLLRLHAEEAARKITTAKTVLDSWTEVYLQVRERIEVNGRDPRSCKKIFCGSYVERTWSVKALCFYWSLHQLNLCHQIFEFLVELLFESSFAILRWEFDRKRLFEKTTYMSAVCVDLLHIIEVVNDFFQFLGPELKSVTGDVQSIDAMIQVCL